MYFRSISTASDVHDHFLGFFFFMWQVLFHIFPSWVSFPCALVDNCFNIIYVFSQNVDTVVLRLFWTLFKRFGQHRTAKIFPGLTHALSHYRLSRQSDSNPILQKLTLLEGWSYLRCLHGEKLALLGGLPYQADRLTLPLGWPYLSCKPNQKIQ